MNLIEPRKAMLAIVLALALAGTLAHGALAHERRPVDRYEFVVGFLVEPAFEGIKNGVDLRVSIPAATDGGEATPVEGLEESMQVEMTHIPSGVAKTVALRTIFRDPGHYTADLIPTAPGPYRFRFVGTIDGLPVDETFESGPGRFGEVESSVDVQFPEQLPAAREFESALRGVQADMATAQANAATTMNLALAGLVLGGIGAIAGFAAVFMVARRPR